MEKKKLATFLHGTLEAAIFHATTYTPSFPFNCIIVGKEKAAYVTIKLDQTKVSETSHKLDRIWNQTFRIRCAHSTSTMITITLKTRHSVLGMIQIPAQNLLNEATPHDGFFTLFTDKGKPNPKLKLQFRLHFRSAESDHNWGRDIKHGGFQGLESGVSFEQRSNCSVILYQDAHHRPSFRPPVYIDGLREVYRPRKLWEDVYRAIDGAKHLVYIAGWSLNPKMILIRDNETEIPHGKGVSIGDLLKQRAEEGVAVRIMLWDDETSLPIIKNKGLMRTHDEEALDYFKHTKVLCKLCPRLHNKFPTLFAHHQKTITTDTKPQLLSSSAQPNDGMIDEEVREIVSFIGGLDLCDGRYDTEEHSLFQTLNTDSHANDFYQINFDGASLHKGGPREPWHDVHACVMGDAAWDVLANFEQRWTKQCDPSLLFPFNKIPNLLHHTCHPSLDHTYNWNVQVFRSIDRISTRTLPDDSSVEHSIHEAYVETIRRAEKFIYIENQYFIGGCHIWEKDRHCGCKNLIPVEIALKVVSKIRSKERFAVYIVIPMWPEGVPESEPVQDILHWTRLTMSMMYKLIGEAIQESGESVNPRDYLNFFCLANREKKSIGEFVPPCSPQHTSHYWKAQMHRRFLVYVHSKLMIVDDEYILIGSANMNQRSMDGRRDTEIVIGCHQPEFIRNKRSHGEIHAYRMSLWYEHTGHTEELFSEPESVECVRKIRCIGEEMWSIYSGEEEVDMEGVHLVNYPVTVSMNGCVEDRVEGGGTFPDTSTLIRGKRSKFLPPIFTT
ncbi:phospholipase D alpha 4 [Tasmannia lanceolata]|uniref:phospholipase D alpha 4 n=1 Tax=Tasmannia lanceolata TaxID=3420 RepID=UPI00406303DB